MSASQNHLSAPFGSGPICVSDTFLWQRAFESLMVGVLHSIGSRVWALSGIARMAEMGRELDGMLLSLLEEEVEHLTDVLQASRILPRARTEGDGRCQMATLVPLVVQLLELSRDAQGLKIEYEGPEEGAEVGLDTTTVSHSVATLLICLGWRARYTYSERLPVRLDAGGGEVELSALLARGDTGERALAQDPDPLIPPEWVIREGLESIAASAASVGGSLAWDDVLLPSSFVYRLPRLYRT